MIETIAMVLLITGCVIGALCGSLMSALVMFPAYFATKDSDEEIGDNVIPYNG